MFANGLELGYKCTSRSSTAAPKPAPCCQRCPPHPNPNHGLTATTTALLITQEPWGLGAQTRRIAVVTYIHQTCPSKWIVAVGPVQGALAIGDVDKGRHLNHPSRRVLQQLAPSTGSQPCTHTHNHNHKSASHA